MKKVKFYSTTKITGEYQCQKCGDMKYSTNHDIALIAGTRHYFGDCGGIYVQVYRNENLKERKG